MSKDISIILNGWDYDPSSISARWIEGQDGKLKIQLRLDLGLFQMEVTGRPDATKPRDHISLLHYYRAQERRNSKAEDAFVLDDTAYSELQQEAMQYYYRYIAFYALHHLEGVIEDTEHNLELIKLVDRHTEDDDMAWQFLQFYPYVLMMNARARAELCMEGKKFEEAQKIVEDALDEIHSFLEDQGEDDESWGGQETGILNNLLEQIRAKKPKSRADTLREEMEQAIAAEDYEKAATLRDTLIKMGDVKFLANLHHPKP